MVNLPFEIHLSETEKYEVWDQFSLLDALLSCRPNIQELCVTDLASEAWTTLLLCDTGDTMVTSQWSTLTTYQLVLDRICEFPNLQHLSIGNHTDRALYNFDRLIESCQSLKSFSVRLYPLKRQVQKENLRIIFISKRSDINKLVCNWELIKGDDQLKYIISYANQPKLERLTISYIANYRNSNKMIMKFKNNVPTLGFGIRSNDTTLSHLEFLSTSGHLIQSLTVEST
ncbi:hypothetical protein INT48_004137 [Thamnidium elegans]|uniref:Uncharacterized protein n=1 Tax=Thamnidium elegans TaxID=101142 RepID=A0A8H7W163_9FUNG|nr:hypothetical protein INT48_004137 [Thamnidium elegans]